MTGFEITAKHNILCQPGRKIKMLVVKAKADTHGTCTEWKRLIVIKPYEHHVLMEHEKGYRESFTHFDVEQMIRKGEIK